MKNLLKTVSAGLLLTAAVSHASASVVQVGSIDKTYGTGMATASTGAGSCDTLASGAIKVSDADKCTRFSDVFDFSSLNYASIDHLTLTLSFGATNNVNLFVFPEDWKVRFADSTGHGSNTLLDMNRVGSMSTQSFILDSKQADVFGNIAANGKMVLWFADQGFGANNFNLYNARLDVFGTAVPEPSTTALFGLALGALVMLRRRAS